jgi:hypothetical protein
MSTLKIWETVGSKSGLPLIRIDERVNYQTVTFTGTAGTSAAFDTDTSVIAVIADVACAVRIGTGPAAVVTDYPLVANTVTHFDVQPGQKISVIAT